MSRDLESKEIDNFFQKLVNFLESSSFYLGKDVSHEREITRTLVGPTLVRFTHSLVIPQLVVRYDGHKSTRPLVRGDLKFLPDAQIALNHQKLVALEVKLIKEIDPTGAITKAVGQTFMYRSLGFESAIAIIFDLRKSDGKDLKISLDFFHNLPLRVRFIYLRPGQD